MTTPDDTSTAQPSAPDPLAPAIEAMERGDHVEARRLALALLGHADAAVQRRARALLDQLAADPVIVGVMASSGLLIAILAALYLGAR